MVFHLFLGQLSQEWLDLLLRFGLLGKDAHILAGAPGTKLAKLRVVGDVEEASAVLEMDD